MDSNTHFKPDWVSPPGDTIASILEERGITPDDFAAAIRRPVDEVLELLQGRAELTREIAQQLANVFGATKSFWSRRESRYREDLARLRQEASSPATLAWAQKTPIQEMIRLGWITPATDKTDLVVSCLQFFGVPNVQSWRRSYKDTLQAVAFRTSKTFASHINAVAAWLRQGEIRASTIKCKPWDRAKFRAELDSIRHLTRIKDPIDFIPELNERCASCGVAVVVLRAPKMCKASGATRFLTPSKCLLLLSGRHLSDDHFWFTFFHEAGHLILHGENFISVDGLEGDNEQSSRKEDEANKFAETILVPAEFRDEMFKLTANRVAVVRFAKRVGVSRGIVVGQLQHYGILKRSELNDLKQRYTWGPQ